MSYHSTTFTNPQLKRLLLEAGIDLEKFQLANIKGRPAKIKNRVEIKGNCVKVYGSDFVATGFLKP